MRAAIEAMWARSEKIARAAVAAMPDGEYRASSFLDNDGLEIGRNVPIEVVVRVSGEEMIVDFSGVADQLRGSINSGREGGAVTAARIAFKYLATPHEPADEGAFRPLKVEIPEGKFLSARAEAPMAMYSTPLPSVIDTVMRAMVKAAPDRLAAGHHSNFGIHSVVGINRRTGERFFNLTSGLGGWGASKDFDGPGPYKTMSTVTRSTFRSRCRRHFIRCGSSTLAFNTTSGGAGQFRGGLGTEKDVLILDDCELQLNFERTQCPPWGVFGGSDAAPPSATVDVAGSPPRRLLKGNLAVKAGDRVHVRMSGGGGFGNPFERDPAAVLRDVKLGYVTQQAAREQYGVVITNDGMLDTNATELLRRGKG